MRRVLVVLGISIGLAAACRSEPRSARPPGQLDATPPSRAAPDAAGTSCVEACVARSQMRATSPAQIEAECASECARAATP
jgi:hypothetical protein